MRSMDTASAHASQNRFTNMNGPPSLKNLMTESVTPSFPASAAARLALTSNSLTTEEIIARVVGRARRSCQATDGPAPRKHLGFQAADDVPGSVGTPACSTTSRRYPHSLFGQEMYAPSRLENFWRRYGDAQSGHASARGRSHAAKRQSG